ncbi:oxalate decarboxylase [Lentinula aff. lateritia]|uniref:Oxalate decarboxylase n=1 Tax=Lentinula aff. lateritia TaxID=2804960 RepID=A0ACC1UDS9_9AGAR|nr:oxalate decarboxylase [Lentinula aff. lateritia]
MRSILSLLFFTTLSTAYGAALLSRDATSTLSSAAEPTPTVPYASTAPNAVLWGPASSNSIPKPFRGKTGGSVLGPDNIPIDLQNPDLFAPPSTDNGDVPNSKWPFSMSHMRLQTGGWARQQNTEMFPVATCKYNTLSTVVPMAAVDMRLEAGAIRELHWHSTAEWAYVLKGTTQVTSVDQDGRNFIATVRPGDLWYFPPGIPHSLQATNDSAEGSEFLLVFPDGAFSDDGTFLLTDWLAHVPAEVIRKNFGITNPDAFSRIPSKQLYIFPAAPPADDAEDVADPQGTVPQPFFFPFSQLAPTKLEGGSVKIADSTVFDVSRKIAVAEVEVEAGGMREMHWHPTQDEWTFVLEGEARITIFAANSNARTFNFQAGDIGFIPASYGHYVENTGNGTLKYLEVFNSDRFQDISLNQWLALTPPALVKAHLGLDDETIALLKKVKPTVVGPPSSFK